MLTSLASIVIVFFILLIGVPLLVFNYPINNNSLFISHLESKETTPEHRRLLDPDFEFEKDWQKYRKHRKRHDLEWKKIREKDGYEEQYDQEAYWEGWKERGCKQTNSSAMQCTIAKEQRC